MIYITGDCHGNFKRFTKRKRMGLPFELAKDDYVIICGDFGLLWNKNTEFKYNVEWLSSLPFMILWVQGNHENYDMIAEYPVEPWNGGIVRHIVRDRIILLERGQVFNIGGKTFFTFGGASSHDVQGGILDKNSPTYDADRRWAVKNDLPYRVRGYSWWEQELPTEAELQEGRDNLAKVEYCVDYVITHCLSGDMQDRLAQHYGNRVYGRDVLTDYFDELEIKVRYKHWFCGHYHINLELDAKHTILYEDIVELENGEECLINA